MRSLMLLEMQKNKSQFLAEKPKLPKHIIDETAEQQTL